LAGERGRILFDFARRARGHQMAAEASGARSEIDDVVGPFDGLGIMLHNQHGVAQIAQTGERIQQAVVVARMQPNGGFIQDIQHAAKF
jgi:hypothetical protein